LTKARIKREKTAVSLEGFAHHLLGPSPTWCAPVFSNCQAFSSSIPLALHDRHNQPTQKEICYINLLYLSLLNWQFSNNLSFCNKTHFVFGLRLCDSTTCIVVIVVEQQCCKWEGKDRGKQTDQEQKKANDHSQIDY
jgi:hypothetical protein